MGSSAPRQIDKLPILSPRPKEMKVLCLGLSRNATRCTAVTTTSSSTTSLTLHKAMYEALKELGYTPYHAGETLTPANKKAQHSKCWGEALYARCYSTGEVYGRTQFDQLLGQYDVRHIRLPIYIYTDMAPTGSNGLSLRQLRAGAH